MKYYSEPITTKLSNQKPDKIDKKIKADYPPKQSNKIQITGDSRVMIAGKTGSGKSTIAGILSVDIPRFICIDSKDGLRNEWGLSEYDKDTLKLLREGKPVRIRVVHDNDALTLCEEAYKAGNVVIYIDEVTALIPTRTVPQIIVDIWTRGRSRNVGGWASTQRPSGIPLIFISEAENFFIFRLSLEDDRKRFSGVVGKEVEAPIVDKYGFWYYNTLMDKPVLYKGIKF